MAELTAIISAEEPNELGVELGFPIGPFSVCFLTMRLLALSSYTG